MEEKKKLKEEVTPELPKYFSSSSFNFKDGLPGLELFAFPYIHSLVTNLLLDLTGN